jgi:spermidine synthase
MKLKKSFPFFLKLASYFYPVTIEKSSTPYELELVISKNRLILNSAHANQSNEGLQQAFHLAFHQLGVYDRKYKNILVLGFGLGSVVELLHAKNCTEKITAYENNPLVLAWLDKYYNLGNIQLHTDSAENLAHLESNYDLILVDLFLDDQCPEFLNNLAYWTQLKTHLSPSGMLIWNTLIPTKPNANFSMEDIFEKKLEVEGVNRMWIYN